MLIHYSDGTSACHYKKCPHTNGVACLGFPIDPKQAVDPNDKAGSLGVEAERFFSGQTPLSYTIHFENLETATAPAATVMVTDALDVQHLDLDSLSLGPISFGDFALLPAPGQSEYSGGVDLRPEQNIVVTVSAKLDKQTGVLTWRFDSIDQETGQSTEDPAAGFLPPNVNPPAGEGGVAFTVQPRADLPTGTEIPNRASIVFDTNPPLDTAQWINTIDQDSPESHVLPLPARSKSGDFSIDWTGADDGAGILDYTIYVSQDRGPFTAWLTDTTDTSATFTGQTGRRYDFFSVARDRVGHTEAAPAVADTRTVVITCVGDCHGDGEVSVDELIRMVRIALGDGDAGTCPSGDANLDGTITIDEIVTAVDGALSDCR